MSIRLLFPFGRGYGVLVAGQPKKSEKMRKRIAEKILADELLTDKEAEWYSRHSQALEKRGELRPVFTKEQGERGRATQRALREAIKQGRLEGAKDAMKGLSSDAVGVLALAMQKMSDEALVEDGQGGFVVDTSQIEDKTLGKALQAAKYVLDQSEGRATQKIEGSVDHKVTFWDKLKDDGVLDLE